VLKKNAKRQIEGGEEKKRAKNEETHTYPDSLCDGPELIRIDIQLIAKVQWVKKLTEI